MKYFKSGDQCTKDGEVRLQGGTNEAEGRVEFCFSGLWWEVYDDGWDEVDANVVCSQLGYGNTGSWYFIITTIIIIISLK